MNISREKSSAETVGETGADLLFRVLSKQISPDRQITQETIANTLDYLQHASQTPEEAIAITQEINKFLNPMIVREEAMEESSEESQFMGKQLGVFLKFDLDKIDDPQKRQSVKTYLEHATLDPDEALSLIKKLTDHFHNLSLESNREDA